MDLYGACVKVMIKALGFCSEVAPGRFKCLHLGEDVEHRDDKVIEVPIRGIHVGFPRFLHDLWKMEFSSLEQHLLLPHCSEQGGGHSEPTFVHLEHPSHYPLAQLQTYGWRRAVLFFNRRTPAGQSARMVQYNSADYTSLFLAQPYLKP